MPQNDEDDTRNSTNGRWRTDAEDDDSDDGPSTEEMADQMVAAMEGLSVEEKATAILDVINTWPEQQRTEFYRRIKGDESGDMSDDESHGIDFPREKEIFHSREQNGWRRESEDDTSTKATARSSTASKVSHGLFELPPPREDCPLCFLPIPRQEEASIYHGCCGKHVCQGCYVKNIIVIQAENDERSGQDPPLPPLDATCPFCRTEMGNDDIVVKQTSSRAEANDADAIYMMATYYENGHRGQVKDKAKALELYTRAADLGSPGACEYVGHMYEDEECQTEFGVEPDEEKALYYNEKAASLGNIQARARLAKKEMDNGNLALSMKHILILAEDGDEEASKQAFNAYRGGFISKEEYARIIRTSQNVRDAETSEERDKAERFRRSGGKIIISNGPNGVTYEIDESERVTTTWSKTGYV